MHQDRYDGREFSQSGNMRGSCGVVYRVSDFLRGRLLDDGREERERDTNYYKLIRLERCFFVVLLFLF